MTLVKHQNIPVSLHRDDREIVAFLQGLLDARHYLLQTGMRVTWKSTATLQGPFLRLNGATVNNADYPRLIAYAADDSTFTVGASTTVLPNEANTWIAT